MEIQKKNIHNSFCSMTKRNVFWKKYFPETVFVLKRSNLHGKADLLCPLSVTRGNKRSAFP